MFYGMEVCPDFLRVPRVGLQSVIVAFPDQMQLKKLYMKATLSAFITF